jgi:NADP-dependent 3-hydroxy acid dehydrogenase YdfG
MSGLLTGRVALITGASSGIGAAIAWALAAAGVRIAVTARRSDRLEELVRCVEAQGHEALAIAGDIADEKFASRIVDDTVACFGRLDIVVNSAGILLPSTVEHADIAEWRRILDVNLMATLFTCRAAIPIMRAQSGGDIINISSLAARRPSSVFNSYSTSKFGLRALSEGLRQEVGESGIRVCTIEPGVTVTEIANSIPEDSVRQALINLTHKDGSMPPEDVAAAIVFVVSLPPRANVSELLIRPTVDVGPFV